jgi:serine/threonine protein kinase
MLDGKYEVEALLGKGGMSRVYEATHCLTRRRVAIKCLYHASSAFDPRRLLQEGRAIARIEHPNVVQVLDLGFHDAQPYLVMERLRGRSLSDHLLEKGTFTVASALALLDPVLDALHRFHEAGVVHRDLKPANLFVVDDGVTPPHLKVLDFGVASLVPLVGDSWENQKLTGSGTSLGTPLYMAPEQLTWQKADRRTDVFALGAILHEMVTGQRAFPASDMMSLLMLMASENAPARALRLERAVPTLGAVLARALAHRREARFQSAEELRLALRQASSGVCAPEAQQLETPLLGARVASHRSSAAEFAGDTEPARQEPEPARREASGKASHHRGRSRRVWALGFVIAVVGLGTAAALVSGRHRPVGVSTTVQAALVEAEPGASAGGNEPPLPRAGEGAVSNPAPAPPAARSTPKTTTGKRPEAKKSGSMPRGIPE